MHRLFIVATRSLAGLTFMLLAPAAVAIAQPAQKPKLPSLGPSAPTPGVVDQVRNFGKPQLKVPARRRPTPGPARPAAQTRAPLRKETGTTRLAQANGASTKCRRPTEMFLFNVEQEDIRSLLKKIARITCKNYIISEGVKGKNDITIISHREVSVSQAERAFLAALEANNMALIPTVPYVWKGKTYYKYYKVVERKEAKTQPLPMYEDPAALPNNDSQVTLMYPLQFAGKDQVQGLLKGMMSKSGDLQDIGGNLLIITDSASNIRRLVKILEKVDVSGSSSRMHIVDIQYAEASAISQKIQDIFNNTSTKSAKGAAGGGDEVTIEKIIADERTNKLIIICSVRAFQSVRDVIDILDRPEDINSTATQVFVHALNNADAQKTASTLSSLAQGSRKTTSKSSKNKKTAAQSAELFEGEVKITADEATNALVIVGSARDYNALKKVIDELDVRRPQVFIEAAIMEVAVNENRRFALDAYSGLPLDVPGFDQPGLGIIANEGGKSLVTASAQTLASRQLFNALSQNPNRIDVTSLTGIVDASTAFDALLGAIAFQGPGIPGTEELFGFQVPSFGFVVNALQSSSNVNILSTPHIMTTDNEKAEISVGERVPVLRGFGGGGGGGLGGLGGFAQNVGFEDVKLKFTVTPHVNDSGEIRCEIEQEVADIGGSIAVGGGIEQPIITSRTAKTTVVVRDQQSVVLGGLISDRKTDTESKFPLLGDIPILGWLFKSWSDSNTKTNLLLVLTPYVVRDQSDFAKIYERKMEERREFVEAYYGVATDYNPYIDYDKKTGPLGKLISTLDLELMRIENGGPGAPGEEAVTPETPIDTFGPEDLATPPGNAPPSPGGDSTEVIEGAADDAASKPVEGGQ